MKAQQTKKLRKPLKRTYQPAIAIVYAKLRRIRAHLETRENDHAASARLLALERIAELTR